MAVIVSLGLSQLVILKDCSNLISFSTLEDVKLMKSIVGDAVKVKAAGGIRTVEDAEKMLEAGAERLGSSALLAK